MSHHDAADGVHDVMFMLPDCDAQSAVLVTRWRRRRKVWEGLVTREVNGKIISAWEPALVMEPIGIAVRPQRTAGNGRGRPLSALPSRAYRLRLAQPTEARPNSGEDGPARWGSGGGQPIRERAQLRSRQRGGRTTAR
jgi:hypothetical protein